ncbi:Carboxylesterase family [Aspergillus sclerotialis]|uniref:Carboxylesterase family n=1 Tax=Aspergillus sclerotialis TaxID=2070753 RepID=A0A3A2ZUS1_9EURO|nr:Carboxylesterase family [Aspergillus sclerotialis]
MLAPLAIAALIALGEAGKLGKSSSSFAILVNNTLVPDEVESSNSYLLVRDHYPGSEVESVCDYFGETVAPANHSEDIASLLSLYNSRGSRHAVYDAWVQGNGSDCVALTTRTTQTTQTRDCHYLQPIICTNTAPYESGVGQPAKTARVTLDTAQGTVEGYRDRLTARFQGLPYAMPPVGDLRFKAPQKMDSLQLNENSAPYNATYYRPVCPQDLSNNFQPFSKAPMSEDCLYLNVFTPSIPGDSPVELLPVIFWVHGGSYDHGGASFPYYQGMNLASRENAVVVTIQYRLGVLGFLSNPTKFHTSEVATNRATRDQIMALQWTRDYIQSYGGDPERITVIGESAGGTTIMSFLQMNATKDMFSRAIVESGNTLSGWQHSDVNNQLADLFMGISGCGDLDCLKYNLTAEQLVQYQKKLFTKAQEIYPAGKINFIEPLRPFIDNDLLSEDWNTALLGGRFNKVPTLLTYNHDEFGLFLQENKTFANTPVNFSSAHAYLSTFMLGPERTKEVLNTPQLGFNNSLIDSSNVDTAIVDFTTDYTYRCNGEIFAGYLETHNPDIWELTWEMNVPQLMNGSLCSAPGGRVCHGSEILLFLGSATYDEISYDALSSMNYWQRARNSMDLYGDFARTGLLQFNGTIYARRGNETHNVLHWNDRPEIVSGGVHWDNCLKMQEMGLYDRLKYPYRG